MLKGYVLKPEDMNLLVLEELYRSGFTSLWLENGQIIATPGDANGLTTPNLGSIITKKRAEVFKISNKDLLTMENI